MYGERYKKDLQELTQAASPARYLQEAREIFHEAQEYNHLLEVICFRVEEFEENGASIIGLIKKEGILVGVN